MNYLKLRNLRKKFNVLIFPGGTEIGNEIFKSLKGAKEVTLFSASNDVVNHAPYIFENHYEISSVNNSKWIDDINLLISKHKINFIFPANPYVIDALIEVRDLIKCELILPSNEVVKLIRLKSTTYKKFKEIIAVPKVYSSTGHIDKYPVFVKPDNGYGSQGTKKVNTPNELKSYFNSEYVVSEYLDGPEYSVDCFSNINGNLLFSQARTRERIRMGTSMHSNLVSTEQNQRFKKTALAIANSIKITGSWFFQMKEDSNGILKLLEIEPRIAGTMAINRVRGVNFALLSILEYAGISTRILINQNNINIDRCLQNKYDHSIKFNNVYIDLDDTIIINNRINLDMIMFLYQCINDKIPIILITKSTNNDLKAFLTKFKIKQLFDEIIWIKESDKKFKYITLPNSIFIDDSYTQRLEVSKNCKIPTFDPSMIEMLINYKI